MVEANASKEDFYAGTTRPVRYFSFLIDQILALICMLAIGANAVQLLPKEASESEQLMFGVAGGMLYFGYYFIFEWLLSATPGKLLMGLRVRRTDGRRCGALAALIRTLVRLIEANPVFLGGLPAAIIIRFSDRHRRLGDSLAGTVVVPINRTR